jgi:SSS family solute:Na+ symporter
MPQFFGKRFDDRSRIYLTIISVFVYLFIKVGVTILAGGIVLKAVMGWDTFTSAILLVLLTGLYTVIGGMYAVVYTQVFQTILIIASAFLLSLFGYLEVGGFSNLYASLPHDYFQLLKPLSDQNIPWTGILFGAPILGIWYWCSDQYIVQRIISSKGLKQARRGTLLASLLKIFPVFLLIFPGLIAASLYPGLEGDNAYALLLGGPLLPMGIKGMVLAGFFAALMSSLSSAFNSAASLFSLDIYNLIKPKASEEELVLVGRLTTVVFVIAAISIIPLTKLINTGIYIQLQILQAYIAPPIVSVFLLGIFWKNASGRGAIWALIVGGSVGAVKIVLMTLDQGVLESFYILIELNQINYLHFAVVLLILSSLIMISVSITGKKEKDSTAIEKPNQVKTNIPVSSSVNQIKQIEINSKNKGELVHK